MAKFTIESLKRAYYLSQRESVIRNRIRQLNAQLNNISPIYDGFRTGRSGDKMAKLIAEKVDLEKDLQNIREKRLQVNKETLEDIEDVDEWHKDILIARFVELKSWTQIGMEFNQPPDAIRMKITRFIQSQDFF